MTLTDHVKDKSTFQYYREGNLYYKTDTDFEFTIPTADVVGATILAQDKSMFFMRWIRKQMLLLANKNSETVQLTNSRI